MPVDDAFARGARLRADGRLVKDQLLVQVRRPAEVKDPWNLLTVEKVVAADEIIRPIGEGNRPLLDG